MNKKPVALIVDDEPDILQLLGITLTRMDIDTVKAETLTQAKILLKEQRFDFCLTDMRLPDGDGIDLIKHIQLKYHKMPVVLITAHGNMETAIEAMKAGAFDFLSKPVDLTALRTLIKNALTLGLSLDETLIEDESHSKNVSNTNWQTNSHTNSPASINEPKNGKTLAASSSEIKQRKQLIGDTPVMKKLKQTIIKLSRSQAPVFISGESGTGKELVARLIHHKGPRSGHPFVPVNCGAIPSELMESEFFGHVKGSFTGAISDKKGLFQSADGGTLFLDEIAELPIPMQVKLLRAIQEKSIRPVGSEIEITVDIRILSASHKDLMLLVNENEFRQDLFYRINVIELQVPALRQRIDDIPKLTGFLVQQLSLSHGIEPVSLSEKAMQALINYDFPGNIRELENILERAITLAGNEDICVEDLNLPSKSSNHISQTFTVERENKPLDEFIEEIEKAEIIKALKNANGNKTKAAKILGISYRAMRHKLDKLGL